MIQMYGVRRETYIQKKYIIPQLPVLNPKTNLQSLQGVCLQSCKEQEWKDP